MRIYNGCPGPELQRILDTEKSLMNKLRERHSEAHCTFAYGGFGHPEGWCVHVWGNFLTDYYPTKLAAISAALEGVHIKNEYI